MSNQNVVNLKDYLPQSETITSQVTGIFLTTNQEQDIIIEASTNTFNFEKTVTPGPFILKSNESYKVIKTSAPLNYNKTIETDKTETLETVRQEFDFEKLKFLYDDIFALTNQNSLLMEKNKHLLEEVRELRENKRLYSSSKEEIKSELKEEYNIVLKGEKKQMKKILDLQLKFLLDGLIVLVIGFLGMFLYYGFNIKFFTPILYLTLILGGLGWFLTALISMRRNE